MVNSSNYFSKIKGYFSNYIQEKDENYYLNKIIELVPELGHYHKSVLNRLRDIIKEKGLPDLKSYYRLLSKNREELAFLKKNMTLMGSHFFRGSDWDTLSKQCLPAFKGREKVRVWSAGCSSGEEVYSTIMALLDYVPVEAIEVLATDYNPEMLERCRKGKYGPTHYSEVPEKYREHLVMVNTSFTFSEEIRNTITTRQLNLLLDDYPQGFDLIVCRNVIKFFKPETVKEVQKKLVNSLAEGGYLFLAVNTEGDNQETITDPQALNVQQIGESIYRKL